MKNQMNSKDEKVLFISMVVLLFMCGVAFDYEINKGLFKDSITKPTVAITQAIEQFSPAQPVDFMPIALGIIVLLLVVLRKENVINLEKISRFFNNMISPIYSFIKKYVIPHFKRLSKRDHRMPSIDIARITHKVSKIKPHKALKEYYHANLKHKITREFKKTRDLLTKPYEESYTPAFVALVFIIAVIGMSMFAITPYFNPSVISAEKTVTFPVVITEPAEMLSPGKTVISLWSLILAISIIAAVSAVKIKREKKWL